MAKTKIQDLINLIDKHPLDEMPYSEKYLKYTTQVKEEELPWYLATPYSKFPGGMEEAYQMAAEMLLFLQQHGLLVYCPIVHSHTAAKYGDEKLNANHDFWLGVDFRWIKLCKGIIVCKMTGWDKSYGIQREIEWATHLGKQIVYTNWMEYPFEKKD